jgi:hypothetical protein
MREEGLETAAHLARRGVPEGVPDSIRERWNPIYGLRTVHLYTPMITKLPRNGSPRVAIAKQVLPQLSYRPEGVTSLHLTRRIILPRRRGVQMPFEGPSARCRPGGDWHVAKGPLGVAKRAYRDRHVRRSL